jgi:hypothetical protein
MPLTPAQLTAKAAQGKPFIVANYFGYQISELMCKTKGNPNIKENRVIAKHTVANTNGIHVYSEFLPPGTVVEKDKSGTAIKAILPDRSEKTQVIKTGAEVLVTLFKYARDGVGMDIMGDIEVING